MSDKRSVTTDALTVLGNILQPDSDIGRDAIHLAVEPVIAGERMYRNSRIGFGSDYRVYCESSEHPNGRDVKIIGVVDPFLGMEDSDDYEHTVEPGDRVLMVMFPRTITSLRHVWAHPDVPEVETLAQIRANQEAELAGLHPSERWIREYANNLAIDYDELMETAKARTEGHDEYLRGGSNLEGASVSEEFWKHYRILNPGGKFDPDMGDDNFFSCWC